MGDFEEVGEYIHIVEDSLVKDVLICKNES